MSHDLDAIYMYWTIVIWANVVLLFQHSLLMQIKHWPIWYLCLLFPPDALPPSILVLIGQTTLFSSIGHCHNKYVSL